VTVNPRRGYILTNRELTADPEEILRLDVAIYDARFEETLVSLRVDGADFQIFSGGDAVYFKCEYSGQTRALAKSKLKSLVRVPPKILLNVLHELREMIREDQILEI
jgi:hypothetical protein